MNFLKRYVSVIGLVIAGLGIALGGRYLLLPSEIPLGNSGSAAIGGPFTLRDHNGHTVTDKNYLGQPFLVYFGYTYCPDVCPTALITISDALNVLGEVAKDIKVLLITVDPERDTAESLKEYVSYFHPSIIGLTGNKKQIDAVVKAYRAFYVKVVEKNEATDMYLVDHSAFTYLMGKNGKLLTIFPHGISSKDMAKGIRERL